MNANVHESTEVRHVGYSAFKHHLYFQIGNFLHVLTERWDHKLVARVAARLQQLLFDVIQRE